MTTAAPEITVVVPVRNGEDQLPHLLEALAAQTLPRARFELIVVDDRSTDATVALAERHADRVIVAPRRGGSYAARNLGAAAARGAVLAFTDADCVPAPDWLERGLAALAAGDADLVAGHIAIPLGERPSSAALVDFARHLDQRRAVDEGFGATANLFVARETLERVGGFNDKLISGGDTEFGHRALAAGLRLRYAADVAITHPARSTPRQLARKAYRLGFGAAQQRRHAESEALRARPKIYARPGAYKPRLRVYGVDRLERDGVRVGAVQRATMPLVEYFFVRLPIIAGNLSGARRERRAGATG